MEGDKRIDRVKEKIDLLIGTANAHG